MQIPNDLGGNWRLDKFVEYQHFAPAVDPITLVEFAKRRNMSPDECVVLAWYHSLTYSEITAGFLFDQLNFNTLQLDEVKEFWAKHKPNLVFGSARKYVQNMDWFVPLMENAIELIFGSPYGWLEFISDHLEKDPKKRYKNIEKYLGKWKFMGRFSIDLFTEEIIAFNKAGLIDLEIEGGHYDWKKSSNLTSGIMNIFYKDEEADAFDRGAFRFTERKTEWLNRKLEVVLQAVVDKYPNQEVDKVSVVNKICSFRNLFKKSRYGGYHHDRQLGNLVFYQKNYPLKVKLWNDFYSIRKSVFPRHMLGEYNGWNGVRKERKKLWVEKGETGVEQTK